MTRTTKLTWTALGGILLSAGMIMPMAHAQSADALLDKLVEKGVLSVREANELREQADEGFNKAFQAKTGMPDWVTQLKLYGDVRGRYEFFRTDNDTPGESAPNKNRDRWRYRLRVGATVTMMDNFEAGFRFTSTSPVQAARRPHRRGRGSVTVSEPRRRRWRLRPWHSRPRTAVH